MVDQIQAPPRAIVIDPASPSPYASVTEALGGEIIDLGGAWARAFEYAQDAELSEPRAFADEYAAFIEDYACELHYPDLPAPSPSEYWESTR